MKIIDVHEEHAHMYRIGGDTIQKATSFGSWNDVKKQLYSDASATVLLMDESCFLRSHMTIRITQSEALTWTQYKALVSEKIAELQSNYGIKPEQLTYAVKNITVNKEPAEFLVGESGTISFDLCFFALDTKWSDIVHLKHVRFYPRRYFLLDHPMLSKKQRMHLLVIDGKKTSLIRLENGRYKHIAQLNGGDDLLGQAYEQAGLDPYTAKTTSFDKHSIGGKLLAQAHEEYTSVLLGRAKMHLDEGDDTMLISRLMQQQYFVKTMSKTYLEKVKGRLIPYRASELFSKYQRQQQLEEIPLLLMMERGRKSKK